MGKTNRQKVYAILHGREIGLFSSWSQVAQRVEGFPNAKHKSFESESLALEWLKTTQNKIPGLSDIQISEIVAKFHKTVGVTVPVQAVRNKRKTSEEISMKVEDTGNKAIVKRKRMDVLEVWTDGACTSNGYKNARAGLGVYFGPNDPKNLSERVPGAQTNNRGEVLAAIRALEVIENDIPVKIYTDSKYLIKGLTEYMSKWKQNGWKTSTRQDVKNKELWIRLDSLVSRRSGNVEWEHIYGHTGNVGNECADQLAVSGCRLPLPKS